MPPVTKCGASKGEGGGKLAPWHPGVQGMVAQDATGSMYQLGPRKVGGRSLVAFRTSVIFDNDRVTAEVPSQC